MPDAGFEQIWRLFYESVWSYDGGILFRGNWDNTSYGHEIRGVLFRKVQACIFYGGSHISADKYLR